MQSLIKGLFYFFLLFPVLSFAVEIAPLPKGWLFLETSSAIVLSSSTGESVEIPKLPGAFVSLEIVDNNPVAIWMRTPHLDDSGTCEKGVYEFFFPRSEQQFTHLRIGCLSHYSLRVSAKKEITFAEFLTSNVQSFPNSSCESDKLIFEGQTGLHHQKSKKYQHLSSIDNNRLFFDRNFVNAFQLAHGPAVIQKIRKKTTNQLQGRFIQNFDRGGYKNILIGDEEEKLLINMCNLSYEYRSMPKKNI